MDRERSFWNSFSGKYDLFIGAVLAGTYKALFKKLKQDVAVSDHILEIATGTGLLSFGICRNVQHITAIDYAPEMLRTARKKQLKLNAENIDFESGDATQLNYEAAAFDKVIASNILHLLPEPETAMSEICRVLKHDGKAILATFCHGENSTTRSFSRFFSIFGFTAHHKWSVKGFEEFVGNNGFTVVQRETLGGIIPMVYILAQKA